MRKEIQEHFERLDRAVVNINDEAARNYLVLNDKLNDILYEIVQLKNILKPDDGGTPLMCSSTPVNTIALADIRPIPVDKKFERFKKRIAKIGGYRMLARLTGINVPTIRAIMNRELIPDANMIARLSLATSWPIIECERMFRAESEMKTNVRESR